MSQRTNNSRGFGQLSGDALKQMFIWLPVVIGIVRQVLLAFFGDQFSCVPVILDPPGEICVVFSVQVLWWFILLIGSAGIAIAAYSDRLESIAPRLAIPFYIYIIFLLIFVKPIG